MKRYYWFIAVLTLVAAAAAVAQALLYVPIRHDRALTDRLQQTNERIQEYARAHSDRLPADLAAVGGDVSGITYGAQTGGRYQLCATFETSSQAANKGKPVPAIASYPSPNSYLDTSKHGKGYQCFTLAYFEIMPLTPMMGKPTPIAQ